MPASVLLDGCGSPLDRRGASPSWGTLPGYYLLLLSVSLLLPAGVLILLLHSRKRELSAQLDIGS